MTGDLHSMVWLHDLNRAHTQSAALPAQQLFHTPAPAADMLCFCLITRYIQLLGSASSVAGSAALAAAAVACCSTPAVELLLLHALHSVKPLISLCHPAWLVFKSRTAAVLTLWHLV